MTPVLAAIARMTQVVAVSVAMMATPIPAHARSPEIYTGILSRTAAGGYDVVAYFSDGKAVPGRRDITHQWKRTTWRFSTEANREKFRATPEAYAPQYGGYCAWAVSQGYTASGDPQQWNVVKGKLYLNYNASVKKQWEGDIPRHIARGDKNWPKVLEK
jgi:hypothetical protein